ncbi:ABC transporter ATP-binding protein [Heliophilum fasciatum]|uniref:ABC-type quaternary amine transporter n=1 Tax=Heliophilum fasciatum TaxID=35700 RepID=A0A4V2SY51_9FIRM|nr:ABC transporter ATP-binding protein [Heliophilum fasciatum]MCW2276803.1 sulfate transport system ATP-binding protein [Heliophilum fasciatum]TCP68736.1 sulfate transport system ATP-binding protein [Heliophilum fasciatum]
MSIEVRNLSKSFVDGHMAVRGVSFELGEGEMTAFLGPSGGGKTTILRMIAGLEKPSGGEIYISGQRVDHLPPQERKIGVVFQNYALFKHMNVFENVAFGLRVQKQRPDVIQARVRELLRRVDLQGLEGRFPDQLSGGQRQRVALARALANEPRLLLLDEPFSAVDAQLRKELRSWVRKLQQDLHITSIFVTHDQQEALEIADRVVVFRQGQLEQIGTPEEIYDSPDTPFVAAFVGEVNRYRTVIKNGVTDLGVLQFPAGNVPEGQEVVVIVRPENVELMPWSAAADIQGIVLATTFLGEFYKVDLELADLVRITAHVPKALGGALREQERVALQIKATKIFNVA